MALIDYELKNRVSFITLNRPEKRNALNPELVKLLTACFLKANTDENVKVIVLSANGEVFSAGADLAYLQQLQSNSYEENVSDSGSLKELFYTIYTSPKLVIAQVEGHAIAGGCGLASVCDLVFSIPEAKFGYTEVKIGFIPALVACFLVRKLGEARTKELLLSGDLISAEKAAEYGLINFIFEADKIRGEVIHYAQRFISSVSAQSVTLTKELLNMAQNLSLEESLENAVHLNAKARSSDDCKRGISAFLNKEKLEW
ncbi:enoyl-CoA hydratase/isomerase family protein [Daejeonella oryzae]|uniref:enoyl-CoA hydratase/isomerase family protein n=1 Tax=Daejeonella oryzae TaxID=1122943 RepID=UPI000401C6A4|nr:enoyl-CoA hydratase/isomerase family protein [Daejeonella oryzae]